MNKAIALVATLVLAAILPAQTVSCPPNGPIGNVFTVTVNDPDHKNESVEVTVSKPSGTETIWVSLDDQGVGTYQYEPWQLGYYFFFYGEDSSDSFYSYL